ncbi:SDR family NAD(P)-dependent oxidoreductase [Sorangium sp. So ce590]
MEQLSATTNFRHENEGIPQGLYRINQSPHLREEAHVDRRLAHQHHVHRHIRHHLVPDLRRDRPVAGVRGLDLPGDPSKSALNAVTIAFAQELAGTAIKVNAVCPGYVATDLNNHSGTRTVAEGAREPVRLALLGPDGPTGTFSDDAGPIPW